MTPERACAALERRIEALFAEAADGPAAAYLVVGRVPEVMVAGPTHDSDDDSREHHLFRTFANGEEKPEFAPLRKCDTLEQAVDETVAAVLAAYPDAAKMRLYWRCRPQYEDWPYHEFKDPIDDRYPSIVTEAGWMLRCRLVGVPLRLFAGGKLDHLDDAQVAMLANVAYIAMSAEMLQASLGGVNQQASRADSYG